MPRDASELRLEPVGSEDELQALVEHVFSDPGARRGMGWTEDDDPAEAMEAIWGLWERRFADGWQAYEVRHAGDSAGLAGLGPIEGGQAWWAVYLVKRGEGLGTETGRRLVDRARERDVETLIAVTWTENEASRRMLETLGFREEGPAPYDWAEESELSWLRYRRKLAEDA